MSSSRYFLRATRAAVLIGGTLVLAVPTHSQSKESGLNREQQARLRDAEQIADSVMTQMHKTLDFEPLLTERIAPDVLKALRDGYKLGAPTVTDRDVLQFYSAGLTVLYLTPLLQSSLKMSGLKAESNDDLPPEVKSAVEGLPEPNSAMTEEQLRSYVERLQKARATRLKYIRPEVFTSPAYLSFVESYGSEPRMGVLEDLPGRESSYVVRREGFEFAMVERGGVMKIATLRPAWND